MVWGHLWRAAKTVRNPYPPLMVKAHLFRKVASVETGNLFAEAMG
jgi:hypothetical protein